MQGSTNQDHSTTLPSDFFSRPKEARIKYVFALTTSWSGKTRRETVINWYTAGDPAAVHLLTAVVMDDPDAEVQRWALNALSRIPDRAVIPAMLRGLESPDRVNRMHAILTLRRLRAREGVPRLIALLDDRRARVTVAETLVSIRDERALQPLKAASSRGWWWQRRRLRKCAAELQGSLGY